MNTRHFLRLVAIAFAIALAGFLSLPPKVYVGTHVIESIHSRAWHYHNNFVGGLLGYGSCPLTGQSWYKAEYAIVDFESDGQGIMFSADAERVLRDLIANGYNDEAYALAVHGLKILNERNHSNDTRALRKPLFFSVSAR